MIDDIFPDVTGSPKSAPAEYFKNYRNSRGRKNSTKPIEGLIEHTGVSFKLNIINWNVYNKYNILVILGI